ncbi:MAG: thioredoxin domain-containing protein [Patescibacteria group bacterium]|nr:thioredoxin domain-containing protein [Patescibacteria group bacterium]
MNKSKQKEGIKETKKTKNIAKNKTTKKIVKKEVVESKKEIIKNKKDYFGVIFVSVSVLMFLVLVFSLAWFKNSLFLAKDMIEIEKIENGSKISQASDPFLNMQNQNNEDLGSPITSNLDPFLGENSSKKIKIFYFADFNCSFCFEQVQIIKNVFNKYQDKIAVTWKDYPDTKDKKGFSYQAARAARCAQEQNNFWAYSDLLYKEGEKFSTLNSDLFLVLAGKAGLNLDSFLSCMNENNVDNLILNNIIEAENLGVLGIPYIYINDRDFLGNLDQDELEEIVENELRKNE